MCLKHNAVKIYRYEIDTRRQGCFTKGMIKSLVRRLSLIVFSVTLLTTLELIAKAEETVTVEPVRTEAWRLLAEGDASAAAASFSRYKDREARVGHGTALLTVQPRTAAGLQRSRQLLEDVVKEPIQDDWSVMAAFLLARWYQLHSLEPDAAEGERRLLDLLEARAGHPWADAAAPKLVIAWLTPDLNETEYTQREARMAAILSRVRDPGAMRDARLAMADAALHRGADHTRALPHYRALVAEAAALRPSLRARVMFQAAESAAALGFNEEASAAWRRFMFEFPNDSRAGEARRRAEAILSQ